MSLQIKHILRVVLATATAVAAIIVSSGTWWFVALVLIVHSGICFLSAFLMAEQQDKIEMAKRAEEHDRWVERILESREHEGL